MQSCNDCIVYYLNIFNSVNYDRVLYIMYKIFLVIFLIVSIVLIVLIMLQQENNNSSGIFDNRALGNILNVGSFNEGISRVIVILAVLFFVCSLLLGNMNSKHNQMCTHSESQNNQLQNK